MFDSDYPRVKQSLGQAALQDPYPAWFLDPRGVIRAANLMAFWLWNELGPGNAIRRDALLGISAFNILAHNFERIPLEQNIEFYMKRAAVVKRLDAGLNSPLYTSFIAAMQANPNLVPIYEHTVLHPNREWDYPLRIVPPELNDARMLLEFQVSNYLLEGDAGILVVYTPNAASLPIVEEQHSLLAEKYSDKVYVLTDTMEQEGNQLPSSLQSSARPYYPIIIQDPLWYIIGENKANQLLVGDSVKGKHFFELFFAPQLQPWMGPLQETSAPRAIRYFDTLTAGFPREDHELHAEYMQVMKRLLQLPDFRRILDISRKLHIHLNIPKDTDTPFYTCRVMLPWPLSYNITLHFRSLVRFIPKNVLVHTDRRHYEVTLIPENHATEVALILLHLASPGSLPDDVSYTPFKQFLYGLALLKTVVEGLPAANDENTLWEPEAAFGRIHSELDTKFGQVIEDRTDELIAELRAIIGMLDKKELVDKVALLTMLISFASTKSDLVQLHTFFKQELEGSSDEL